MREVLRTRRDYPRHAVARRRHACPGAGSGRASVGGATRFHFGNGSSTDGDNAHGGGCDVID
ncbi:hypothetical protein GCM10009641_81280 [Mycobacterium cookii]|uniref:Uncharacterized protein n=1 Tax=Nocardioides furvisabuli TaxID=375542 RepID=A0ABN2WVZ0_9ACTN